MKPAFTLIIAIALLRVSAHAEPKTHSTPLPPAHVFQLLPEGAGFPATTYNLTGQSFITAKAAGTGPRITSRYIGIGTVAGAYRNKDSVHYTFSGTRGGDLTSLNINYDEARYFTWDTVASKWAATYIYTNTYDTKNLLIAQVVQKWNVSSSAFVNSSQVSITYNALGQPTMIKSSAWNMGTSSWVNFLQYTGFVYNASGNPTTYVMQQWALATSTWTNNQRITATYDAYGDLTSWLTDTWSIATFAWTNSEKETYTYNAAHKNTQYIHQLWDVSSNIWRNAESYNYFYNASNYDIGYTHRVGDALGQTWVNVDSVSYTALNSMGAPLTELSYTFGSAHWQNTNRYTNTYTGANLQSSTIIENWDGTNYLSNRRDFSVYNGFGQLFSYYGQTYKTSIWGIGAGDGNERYAYQNYATQVTPITNDVALQLYPIPAGETLQITMQWHQPQRFSIGVYDITGRQLLFRNEEAVKDYNGELATDGIANGIYVLRILGEQGSCDRTFIVSR